MTKNYLHVRSVSSRKSVLLNKGYKNFADGSHSLLVRNVREWTGFSMINIGSARIDFRMEEEKKNEDFKEYVGIARAG